MAELVGLLIGVVSLLPPAISAWQTCTELFNNTQKYAKDVRKAGEKLFVQRNLFERECELLLRCVVTDPATVRAMMADDEHPHWRDKSFKLRWSKIMGDDFDVPIKIVLDTLEHMRGELEKLEGKAQGKVDEKGRLVTSKASRRRMARTMANKVDWIISGKTRLQQLICTLRDQNQDLRNLREQRAVLEPPLYTEHQAPRTPAGRIVTEQMLRIRADAKNLLSELSYTAVCECHQVNLKLPGNIDDAGDSHREKRSVSFRFIVTRDGDIGANGHQCTCLTVQSLVPTKVRTIAGLSYSGKEQNFSSTAAVKGKIRFAIEDVDQRWHSEPFAVHDSDSDSDFDSQPPVIEKLCALLADIPRGMPASECLGMIANGQRSTSRYLIFPGPPAYPTLRRLSLEEVLIRVDKQRFLPREERLKIALTLALSLLHFGSYSTSWFQERWRSRDVFFFVDLSGNVIADRPRHESEEMGMEPYVVPFRGASSPSLPDGSTSSAQGLARNEQLYSLTLVLIEIAFGERLFTIYTPDKDPDSVDEFAEYLKAKRIIESRLLGREMGGEFAEVVRRCFYCDFGLGEADFSKRELQDMFYARVVCKLEDCLNKFRGD